MRFFSILFLMLFTPPAFGQISVIDPAPAKPPSNQADPSQQSQQSPETQLPDPSQAQKMLQDMGIDIQNPQVQDQARRLFESFVQGGIQGGKEAAAGIPPLAPLPQLDPAQLELLDRFQRLINNPAMQSYLSFVADPQFAQNAQTLMEKANWKYFAYAQLGLFILLIILRAFLYSRLEQGRWLKRIWIGAWTLGAYWVLATVAIPTIILGDAYVQILKIAYSHI